MHGRPVGDDVVIRPRAVNTVSVKHEGDERIVSSRGRVQSRIASWKRDAGIVWIRFELGGSVRRFIGFVR